MKQFVRFVFHGFVLGLVVSGFAFFSFFSVGNAEEPALTSKASTSSKTSLSVPEAYRAIPHRQTRFDPKTARMSDAEKAYLDRFFSLTDEALIQRVLTMQWFQTTGKRGQDVKAYNQNIEGVLNRLQALSVPRHLRGAHNLLQEAILEQKHFFASWQESYALERRFNPKHPSVQRAHKHLINTYNALIKAYPRESQHNRQAFFDHLCALDFI